jgi:hypothetical protein
MARGKLKNSRHRAITHHRRLLQQNRHKADITIVRNHVRFSNRPVWVKRFQAVDVTRGLVLLSGIGT